MGMKNYWLLQTLLLIPVLLSPEIYINLIVKVLYCFCTLIDKLVIAAPPLSSPFWRLLEPLFGFISDVDIAYLKQQVRPFIFFMSVKCNIWYWIDLFFLILGLSYAQVSVEIIMSIIIRLVEV